MGFGHGRPRFRRQIGGRVGQVHLDPLKQRTKAVDGLAVTGGFHLGDDVGRQLQVPGIVEFACFQNRTTGRVRVAATLEGDLGKGGLAFFTVVFVGFELDHVVRFEVCDGERTGADGVIVGFGALGRLGTQAVSELCGLNDRGLTADKGAIGVRFGLVERDLDGQIVHGLDVFDAVKERTLRTAAFGVHTVFSSEFHVGRGDGRAVGPLQAFLDFPGDGGQVLGHAAIGNRGDFDREEGHHFAGFIVTGQRFQNQRRRFDVLGAARQERVQDRRRLPIEDFHLAIAAAFAFVAGSHCHRSEGNAGSRAKQ